MFFNWSGLAPPPAPPARRHGELVAFGEEPTFSLSTVAGSGPGHTVVHVYGTQHELNNPLSTIVVGTVVPDAHRLDYATDLFDIVDVDAQGFLDSKKLQLAMRVVSIRLKPSEVFRKYGSIDGALLVEEFVLFLSSEAKQHDLVTIVPLDILREIRSLFHLVVSSHTGKLDRHELETLVAYLGLDWNKEDVDQFVSSRRGHDVLSFMNQFVHKVDKGVVSGERSLSVRNWFPGAWFVRDKNEHTRRVLHLYFQNEKCGFTNVGKILSSSTVNGQPLLVALRLDRGKKFNVLVPKMEAAHAQAFRDAALTLFDSPDVPLGVVSTETVVELINKVSGAVHLKELTKHDLVCRVFELLVGDADVVEQDQLLVALKLLGQHAEPQHISYLLSRAPRKSLGDLSLQQIINFIMGTDVRLTLPLQTVEKLKEMFAEFDADGDGALTVPELHELTSLLGLGWTSKDIMTSLGLTTKHKVEDVVLVDFLHFIDAMIEAYGDAFYDLRYRYLFRLIDVQNDNSLQDEELVPILMAAGLDDAAAKAACARLLGGQLTMSAYQFAAGMFEEEITREQFPTVLLNLAMAFSNIDMNDAYKLTADDLLIMFRKLGAKFTQKDLDTLLKQLDPSGDGTCSFKEFAVGLASADRSKLGGLADVFNVETLAFIGSYELTSTVEELDTLRNIESRAWLERTAANVLAAHGASAADNLDMITTYETRRADGILDSIESTSDTAFPTMVVLRVLLCCWFSIFRCLSYGAGSAGFAVLFQQAADKFPASENGPSKEEVGRLNFWAHNLIMYGPTIIVSTVEALVIYYDVLRTSIALTQIAGLKLWPQDPSRMFVANSVVSEALELGHPTYVRFGINPLVGASELVLKLCAFLYKARGGLSKFLIKILLRRVLSRSALKGVFPLVGLPIVAFWDALLAFNVLTAVRTIALGRCCIVGVTDGILSIHQELERQLEAGMELSMAADLARIRSHALGSRHDTFDPDAMSHDLKVALMRAVAMTVCQARAFHPNLELLIKHLMYRLRLDPLTIEGLDQDKKFRECLPQLSVLERYTVITMLTFALVLDGQVTTSQRLYMKQMMTLCGLAPKLGPFMHISAKFNNLVLQPEDVAFCMYSNRQKDDETSGDITLMEQIEAGFGAFLRVLTF